MLSYFIPYWNSGDRQDRFLGMMQLVIILWISFIKALKAQSLKQGILVFLFTWISFVWFIKLCMAAASWFKAYLEMISPDICLTLLVPLLIFFNRYTLKGHMEIEAALTALCMSLGIVYMELINMTLDRSAGYKEKKSSGSIRNLNLKKIFIWLVIVMVNLYTLVVLIQFYWDSETYHFIRASVFDKKSALDLCYYLIVTFTTVGLGDIQPHTLQAKWVTMLIALSGMFFTGIFVSTLLSRQSESSCQDKASYLTDEMEVDT